MLLFFSQKELKILTHHIKTTFCLARARERVYARHISRLFPTTTRERKSNDVSAEHARNDFDGCDDVESTGKVVF